MTQSELWVRIREHVKSLGATVILPQVAFRLPSAVGKTTAENPVKLIASTMNPNPSPPFYQTIKNRKASEMCPKYTIQPFYDPTVDLEELGKLPKAEYAEQVGSAKPKYMLKKLMDGEGCVIQYTAYRIVDGVVQSNPDEHYTGLLNTALHRTYHNQSKSMISQEILLRLLSRCTEY